MQAVTDEDAQIAIAQNVARLRTSQKLSLAEVGRRAQTSAGAIRDIEVNERMPGAGLISRLAEAFGVTVDELFKTQKKSKKSA